MAGVPVFQRKIMLDWFRHCAEQGERCPTNDDICERLGFNSPASATRLVADLEADGLIRVERFHHARVVTIVATGEKTAPVVSKPKKPATVQAARPPAIPAAIVAAAREDGRPLLDFVQALLWMGLECWRDDRAIGG
jgi:SOS-response transcriptional repressor LexA